MKYVTYYALVIGILCLLLSGCRAVDKDNVFEMPEEELEAMTVDPAEDTENEEGMTEKTQEEPETGPSEMPYTAELTALSIDPAYPYGNMQKNLPPGSFMEYENRILFTHIDGKHSRPCLYEIDMDTLEVTPFCKDATCSHQNPKCTALGVEMNLEVYDGKVYALKSEIDPRSGARTSKVMRLSGDHFECILEGDCELFWHADHHLYVTTSDRSLLAYTEEDMSSPQVLMDEYTYFWNTKFGSKIYGTNVVSGVYCTDLSDPEPESKQLPCPGVTGITDGRYIYSIDQDNYLYCSDMNGENIEKPYDVPILLASLNFDDDYIYFRYFGDGMYGEQSNEVYRAPKTNLAEPEKIAEVSGYAYTIYTVPGYDTIFVQTYGAKSDQWGNPIPDVCAVKKDGSGQVMLEIPDF
ncbi:MAG: hypothetical protein IJL78_05775 [Lachnospiraceae bacterium]|nr:hypothetical protein [Lachnospiraceae bacterium]